MVDLFELYKGRIRLMMYDSQLSISLDAAITWTPTRIMFIGIDI